MEKISIRPNTTDIVVDAPTSNELNEVFSYNYGSLNGSDDAIRRLGSLFIVGQIQPKNDDTSYVLNLIASLAKREYYLASNEDPKEAFSKTLKKINEALGDFFKEKDLKINIGVFSIAGDNMFISKLGKFRILLARDTQTIDVLNNISLFNKEKEKETSFSSVISGKIIPGDKILAFYPSRSAIAREKTIRAGLVGFSGQELAETLKGFRDKSDKFSLAGIHLAIIKYKEPAVEKRPQPAELRPKIAVSQKPILAAKEQSPSGSEEPVQVAIKDEPADEDQSVAINSEPETSTPLIIPSEFGVAKKENIFSVSLKRANDFSRSLFNLRRSTLSKQVVVLGMGLLFLLGIVYGAKFLFFGRSDNAVPDSILSEIDTNIKLAKTKISQNEIAQARQILSSSLLEILNISNQNESVITARNEATSVLDEIDRAVDASPGLLWGVDSAVYGKAEKIGVGPGITAVVTDTSKLIFKKGQDPEQSMDLGQISVHKIFGLEGKIIYLDTVNKNIGIADLEAKTVKVTTNINFPEQIIDSYLYGSNLYLMTKDSILRMSDAGSGKGQFSKWFSDTTNLPPSPEIMAVDGDIYVLDKSGTLAKYFKGEKELEKNINFIPDGSTEIMASADSPIMLLVNKELGRIYVLNKEKGVFDKVLKINNENPIVDIAIDEGSILYFLTSDNKVWKLEI